uniref:DUF4915 domain-containing protein n=1 Tax=Bursaphelenchus xylophilus TaxID=6326 RepID=A0A1I7SAU4_BURXY
MSHLGYLHFTDTTVSAEFCRLYCPMACCFPKASIKKYDTKSEMAYDKNSTLLKVSNRFWISPTLQSYGVYAEDEVFVQLENQEAFSIGRTDIALVLIQLIFNYFFDSGVDKIGLARSPDSKNLVERLYDQGRVSSAVVTIVHAPHYKLAIGDYHNEHCRSPWNKVESLGDREWMLGLSGYRLLTHESDERSRAILVGDDIVGMPRFLLNAFINENVLAPREMHDNKNFYVFNRTKFKSQYYFTTDNGFRLDLRDFFDAGDSDLVSVAINAVDINPDNVHWLLSHVLYYCYCVRLDYHQNTIEFARHVV